MGKYTRSPSHAGSWYEKDGDTLTKQIEQWMAEALVEPNIPVRAIIAPHAGYRYCGHVMAHAYKQIDPTQVSRVFLLGPSHHVYTQQCILSWADAYRTPLGDIPIDKEVTAHLQSTGMFDNMDQETDEAEHSLELHLPYIFHALRSRDFSLVPIMVGTLSAGSEEAYGKILGPYLDDPCNFFVISSDFCHWGSRFRYTPYDPAQGPIWKFIEYMDRKGMEAIETTDASVFRSYIQKTRNTICGRHPIGVFLNMLRHSRSKHKIEFKYYDQSSQCETKGDSSVSYAAAVATPLS
ncbi:unnamed protein product [Ostreobium quekettii]|uniref:Protein MEMO1 n=1 Tax=Ostreobium quekettii TaxID=121088 RepID=A0A8S1JA78_9CHLO|nr:unnamed protein product [Ostreobium quekettii]|eukprot:evm.model.scf_957.6 EVM.evm.TU.scf_957.6   scf_957:53839-57959(-)